jgi:hypothetical protein
LQVFQDVHVVTGIVSLSLKISFLELAKRWKCRGPSTWNRSCGVVGIALAVVGSNPCVSLFFFSPNVTQ